MKTLRTLFVALIVMAAVPMSAQTADEILNNYFENTGGAEAWNKLKGVKMVGEVNAQGMQIPVDLIYTSDNKTLVVANFQGQSLTQVSFDGETMWSTNFMTMEAEKSDSEATENMKRNGSEFPFNFINYKEKGYSFEYLGKETKEGTETHKLKFTQNPILVDGKEEPTISFYYFDTENYVPIMVENTVPSGPMKGQMISSTMSDYQEVDGLYFPFSLGNSGQTVTIKEISLNPEVTAEMFAFPEKK